MAIKRNVEEYVIYKATSPSNKVYIGVTGNTLSWRSRYHGYKDKDKEHLLFYRAIKKYGKKSIKWEEIEKVKSLEEAREKEKFYINQYNSNNSNFGYNLTRGGDGCSGLVRLNEREKYIDNSGNIFLGSMVAAEYYGIKDYSVQGSAKNNTYVGLVYFSKYKEGMTCAVPRPFNRRHRKIIEHTTGICFFSLKDAGDYFNINTKLIQRVCYGERSSTHGKKFNYLMEG